MFRLTHKTPSSDRLNTKEQLLPYNVYQHNALLFNLIFHNIFYIYMFRTRGFIFRKTAVTGIIYMYDTSWFIKVWFCNGRSSPVGGRTCTVLSVLYDYITMLCTNNRKTLLQSHNVILRKAYRAEHQLHKCHKDYDSRRKIKSKNCILYFVDHASLYILFQMKPTRCTLLCGRLSGLQTRQPPTQREKYECRIDTVSSPDDGHIVARNM